MIIEKKVISGNKWNLSISIAFLISLIMIEYSCITLFFNESFMTSIGLSFIMQIIAFIAFSGAMVHFLAFKTRREITLYACELNNNIDIEEIKENHIIVKICKDGVVYVTKEDYDQFGYWELLYQIDYNELIK